MTEREMLERIAEHIENGGLGRDAARMRAELEETVWLIGFDPDSDVGTELADKLTESFVFEDLTDDRRPVRLAQAIALGMGLEVQVQTCGHTHEVCPEDYTEELTA